VALRAKISLANKSDGDSSYRATTARFAAVFYTHCAGLGSIVRNKTQILYEFCNVFQLIVTVPSFPAIVSGSQRWYEERLFAS
jgi:hypothetical protein